MPKTSTRKRIKSKADASFLKVSAKKKVSNRNIMYELELDSDNLDWFSAKRTEVSRLSFKGDSKDTDDEILRLLARFLKSTKKIKSLNIDCLGCNEVTDRGLANVFENIKRFTDLENITLNFKECLEITDASVWNLVQTLKGQSHLENIQLLFGGQNY